MLICLFWAALFMPVVLPHCRGSEMTDAEDAMCTTTLQRQWNDRCRRCDVYYHTAEAVKWQMQKMRCVLPHCRGSEMTDAEDAMCTLCSVWKAIFKVLLLLFKFLSALEFKFSAQILLCCFGALSQNCELWLFVSSCPSICMEQLGSTGRIFLEFDIWVFFENQLRKFMFH